MKKNNKNGFSVQLYRFVFHIETLTNQIEKKHKLNSKPDLL